MKILHTCVLEDELVLWGEHSPSFTPSSDPTPSDSKNSKGDSPSHPFGCSIDDLTNALEIGSIGFRPRQAKAEPFLAWLPTRGKTPLPSSSLLGDFPQTKGSLGLEPWVITGYPFSSDEAVTFLAACANKKMLAPGILIGQDTSFWTSLLEQAVALVVSQHFLPGLDKDESAYQARWEPVLFADMVERLNQLIRKMPPSAHACSLPDKEVPAPFEPRDAVEQTLSRWVDYLVRSSVPGGIRSRYKNRHSRRTVSSPHDVWLHALRSPSGFSEAPVTLMADLSKEVGQWRHTIDLVASSPVRFCFSLEEPQIDSKPEDPNNLFQGNHTWHVSYHLQSRMDTSISVSVEQAWKTGESGHPILKGIPVRGLILSALAQASRVCPRINESLDDSSFSGHDLDTTDAYMFLTQIAPLLRQGGFGVTIPEWWDRPSRASRLGLRAKIKNDLEQPASLDNQEGVDLSWEIVLGDQRVTMKELRELSSNGSPLTRVNNEWVVMDPKEVQSAMAYLKKGSANQVAMKELIRLAVGAGETGANLSFEGVQARGWLENFLRSLIQKTDFQILPEPQGFVGQLRPYQIRGFSWLQFLSRWGLGACLADDMGLGKTIQTLAHILQDWNSPPAPKPTNQKGQVRESPKRGPVLLVCPTSVISNWEHEAARFTPQLPVTVHHGLDRKKGPTFKKHVATQALVVTSYSLLQRDVDFIRQVDWHGVVLDEAQNVKNPETKQALAVRMVKSNYRFCLTGTPVENNLGDLWSLMDFLNVGLLGNRSAFKSRFLIPIQAERDEVASARLQRITAPFILRRLKSDPNILPELPEKMEMKVFCTLTEEQRKLYAETEKYLEKGLREAKGIQRRGMILATLTKLKQVCNHPAQLTKDLGRLAGRSGKLSRLTEMLEVILSVQECSLVFSQFAEMGKLLQRHLEEAFGQEILFLHGAVPKNKRDTMVRRFQEDGGPRIFILSLKAGGYGLNLTRASHVFHFDRWWNPAVENQATDRAHRIGQERQVQVHKFICGGTLEEKIDKMLESKRALAEKIVGTSEAWLTELNDEELFRVLKYHKEGEDE